MSYPLLLLLISLVVIVPTVFVISRKSNQKLLTNRHQQQRYIGHHTSHHTSDETKPSAEQLQIGEKIAYYRNHPSLPISFRQVLGKIQSQYNTLHTVKLAPDQRFNVDKLAGTRLPEILEDYLSLDKDYAENSIIDEQNALTSQDITYGQLTSLLDFMERIQDDGQTQVASNILANRSYLQSVYGEFHQDANKSPHVKAPEQSSVDTQSFSEQTLIERGESYLQDNDTEGVNQISLSEQSKVFGRSLLTQLGKLTHSAEHLITYSEALLGDAISLKAFNQIMAEAIPNLLRNTLMAHSTTTSSDSNADSTSLSLTQLSMTEQTLIEQKVERVQQLIGDCVTQLEKVAEQQYEVGSVSEQTMQSLERTVKSKHSQAQYLLESGFFNL